MITILAVILGANVCLTVVLLLSLASMWQKQQQQDATIEALKILLRSTNTTMSEGLTAIGQRLDKATAAIRNPLHSLIQSVGKGDPPT